MHVQVLALHGGHAHAAVGWQWGHCVHIRVVAVVLLRIETIFMCQFG